MFLFFSPQTSHTKNAAHCASVSLSLPTFISQRKISMSCTRGLFSFLLVMIFWGEAKSQETYVPIFAFVPTVNFSAVDTNSQSRAMPERADFWFANIFDSVRTVRQISIVHATADSFDTSFELEYYDLTDNENGDYAKRGKPEGLFKVTARGGRTFHADTLTNLFGAKNFRLTLPESKRVGLVLRKVSLAQAPSRNVFVRGLILSYVDLKKKSEAKK